MASEVTTTNRTSWVDTPPNSPTLRRLSGQLVARMPWLEKVADLLQKEIHALSGEPGQPAYKVKDFLNGVWLGHPLHPVLVTVPVGAWTGTFLLDLISLVEQDEGIERGADLTLWLGLAAAGGAAVTGATNWVDTDGPERRTGIWHALLNTGVTALNVTSAILRLTGQRRTAIGLATLAYAVTAYSAYVGGELGYSLGIGVNHTVWEGGSDDFIPVMDEADLQPGKLTRVEVGGISAVVVKDGESIYAIAATCSHLGGPLDEGTYQDGVVSCPWHNSGFCMRDGSVVNSPAVYAQPTFAVRTRSGKIELRRLDHA